MIKKKNRDGLANEQSEPAPKPSVYDDSVFDAFDKKQGSGVIQMQSTQTVPSAEEPKPTKEHSQETHKEPNKLYRRNITLSEELFRRLEFIKKAKNKARSKDDDMITLDKLMFDMVQKCLDEQYPETKAMFEKYLKLKEMEGFEDLM